MRNGYCVYALCEPNDGEFLEASVRYIGRTSSVQSRAGGWMCGRGVSLNNPVGSWIAGLLSAGLKPDFFVLAEFVEWRSDFHSKVFERETIQYFVDKFGSDRMLNVWHNSERQQEMMKARFSRRLARQA